MAAIITLFRSPPILRNAGLIGSNTGRICLPSLSSKSMPYVVYLSSFSSSYHTKTRVQCKLRPKHNFSQFSMRPSQRNSSYFTSVLQKAFVVSAVEPHPEDVVTGSSVLETTSFTDMSGSIAEPFVETTFQSSVASETISDASTPLVESSWETTSLTNTSGAESVLETTNFTDTLSSGVESVLETTNFTDTTSSSVFETTSFTDTSDSVTESVLGTTNFTDTFGSVAESVFETACFANTSDSVAESVLETTNFTDTSGSVFETTSFTDTSGSVAESVLGTTNFTDTSGSVAEYVLGTTNFTDTSGSVIESVLGTTSFTDTSGSVAESVIETTEAVSDSISYIPPPPAPPEAVVSEGISFIPPPPAPLEAVLQPLNALGEPTLQSLGLGGWTPPGMIQSWLEHLHVFMDLPWWGTIAIATVCIRVLLFPLVLLAQRNGAKMNNNLPQLQLLQMKMTEARNSGNQMESARLAQEMMLFMKEKNISPMKNVIVPLAQAPFFISMFIGLRGMANLPMESMKEGGLFWFTDLTLADPYYLLPLVTATTMLATIELGTDGARLNATNMQNMKWILRALPLLVFPFTVNFPTAVLCYWVSTNFFSLVQVGFLKIPAVRDYFKIPRTIIHRPETLPQKQKGMVAGFKESWSNMKVTKELEERERYDEMRFKKAGVGPVIRTFKHDPTRKKVINVQAKVKGRN